MLFETARECDDGQHRVSQIALKNSANAVLRTQSYTYDLSSKIMSHTVGGVTTDYGYDLAGQLTSETRTGYSGAYTYDANGNRSTRTVNGVQEVYAYDDGDKLLDVKVGGVVVKDFDYDLAGRTKEIITSAGTTTFTYDHESRAVTLTGPGMTQTNVYNGLDTRVGSTTNSVANTYLRDGAYVTDAVLKDSTATFTPGVSERRGSVTTFSHSGLKNADAQSSVSQAVNATQQYDAFGNLASSTGTWQGQFGYGGGFGYQQDATGLKLLGHRYYDSSTGRFLTRDPIKDGRNWYVYSDSDPLGSIDPAGHAPILLGGAIAVLAVIILGWGGVQYWHGNRKNHGGDAALDGLTGVGGYVTPSPVGELAGAALAATDTNGIGLSYKERMKFQNQITRDDEDDQPKEWTYDTDEDQGMSRKVKRALGDRYLYQE